MLHMQVVDEVYDPAAASAMGLDEKGTIVIMIHSGSRGLGHQVGFRVQVLGNGQSVGLKDQVLGIGQQIGFRVQALRIGH